MNRRLLLTYFAAALVAASIALVVKSSWPGRDKSGPSGGGAVPKVVVLDPAKPGHQTALEEYHRANDEFDKLQQGFDEKLKNLIKDFNRVVENELGADIAKGLKSDIGKPSLDDLKAKVRKAEAAFTQRGQDKLADRRKDIYDKVAGWKNDIEKVGELATSLDAIKKHGALEFWEVGQGRTMHGIVWVWVPDDSKKTGNGFWVSKSEIRIKQATDNDIKLPETHEGYDELKKELELQVIPIPEPNEAALRDRAAKASTGHPYSKVMSDPGLVIFRAEVQAKANALIAGERARLRTTAENGRLKPLESYPKAEECVTTSQPEDAQGFANAASAKFGGSNPWRFRLPREAEWTQYQKLTDKLEGIGKSDFSEWVIGSDIPFKVVDKNWKGEATTPPAPGTASFRLVFAAD